MGEIAAGHVKEGKVERRAASQDGPARFTWRPLPLFGCAFWHKVLAAAAASLSTPTPPPPWRHVSSVGLQSSVSACVTNRLRVRPTHT
ncbi:hypothetical protein BHE74_00015580 [Ensete ventricosum]|nr:hypothetical protein BHE74_00015580 [Ensete ventricosum]